MLSARKPLAKAESRDVPKTVRFTPSEVELLERAARENGDDFSRYLRDCALMGHSVRQAQAGWKRTAV